jgi:hypothetical protein
MTLPPDQRSGRPCSLSWNPFDTKGAPRRTATTSDSQMRRQRVRDPLLDTPMLVVGTTLNCILQINPHQASVRMYCFLARCTFCLWCHTCFVDPKCHVCPLRDFGRLGLPPDGASVRIGWTRQKCATLVCSLAKAETNRPGAREMCVCDFFAVCSLPCCRNGYRRDTCFIDWS